MTYRDKRTGKVIVLCDSCGQQHHEKPCRWDLRQAAEQRALDAGRMK